MLLGTWESKLMASSSLMFLIKRPCNVGHVRHSVFILCAYHLGSSFPPVREGTNVQGVAYPVLRTWGCRLSSEPQSAFWFEV